jgi:hypothetical protein
LHLRLHHGDPWGKNGLKKTPKSYNLWVKQTYFWENQGQPTPAPFKIQSMCPYLRASQKLKKVAFSRVFEQKFTTDSYRVRIEHVWCCWKAWGKFGSRV